MAATISAFGIDIYAYGLMATLSAIAALGMMRIAASRVSLPTGTVRLVGALGIPLGILFARILYCAVNFGVFVGYYENPWLMLRFCDGGLAMGGVIIGLVLTARLTARIQKVSFAQVLDLICLPLGLMIALLRIGEAFTDLGIGKSVPEGFATEYLPWLFSQSRMGVTVVFRMRLWLYEALMGLVILGVTLAMRPILRRRSGNLALFVLSLYGAGQIILESLRDDGHMMIVFFRVGQLCAALLPIICTAILTQRKGNRNRRIIAWSLTGLCVIGVTLLEFSLDGRLTWGQPSAARDYGIMFVLCSAMFLAPCLLLFDEPKA